MRPDEVTVVGLGLAGGGAVLWGTVRWWRDRGSDVSRSRRAVAVALAVTALLIPALIMAGAGVSAAQWWVFAVPIAWLIVGVSNVVDQHEARSRDLELGEARRPILWPPYLVAVTTFLVLEATMLASLFLWVVLTGDLDTHVVVSAGGAALCGTFALAGAQHLRLACAVGALSLMGDIEQSPRRSAIVAAMSGLGGSAIVAGVVWASTPTFSARDLDMAARLLVTAPGWVLVGAAWMLVRPQPQVNGGGPSA